VRRVLSHLSSSFYLSALRAHRSLGDARAARVCALARRLYAFEHGFDCFTTTNATSRWKDQPQVNGSGLRAAAKYDFSPFYWKYDWQTDTMTERK
jgi:predicted adenine nucleotide alpha hydrolase (AANH) superfamily ATPase